MEGQEDIIKCYLIKAISSLLERNCFKVTRPHLIYSCVFKKTVIFQMTRWSDIVRHYLTKHWLLENFAFKTSIFVHTSVITLLYLSAFGNNTKSPSCLCYLVKDKRYFAFDSNHPQEQVFYTVFLTKMLFRCAYPLISAHKHCRKHTHTPEKILKAAAAFHLAQCVWQMTCFSLHCFPLFAPLGPT